MTALTSIFIALTIAALTPLVAVATNSWVEAVRRKRAFRRIWEEPLIYPGARIARLECEGLAGPLMLDCRVVDLDVGRLEIEDDKGRRISFTGREFEKLHPVMAARGDSAA